MLTSLLLLYAFSKRSFSEIPELLLTELETDLMRTDMMLLILCASSALASASARLTAACASSSFANCSDATAV